MDKKILYIDCETTGTDPIKNDIIQISLIIEVNNVIKEKHNIFMQPSRSRYENIDPDALEIQNRTVEEIKSYPARRDGYQKIISVFNRYIDRYNKKDKFDYVGYNVHFDINFLFDFFFGGITILICLAILVIKLMCMACYSFWLRPTKLMT